MTSFNRKCHRVPILESEQLRQQALQVEPNAVPQGPDVLELPEVGALFGMMILAAEPAFAIQQRLQLRRQGQEHDLSGDCWKARNVPFVEYVSKRSLRPVCNKICSKCQGVKCVVTREAFIASLTAQEDPRA